MTSIQFMWLVLALSWLVAETVLGRQGGPTADAGHDRGSFRLLWQVSLGGLVLALVLKEVRWLPMDWGGLYRHTAAVLLFAAGIAIRLWAIISLGRFFNTRVALRDQHRLIRSGPYRWVRHPSYTGLLLAFAGAGMAMGDWLASATLIVPAALALRFRIQVEEHALATHFKHDYRGYSKRTKKLFPGIY